VASDHERRAEAMGRLPLPYATALRLRDAGLSAEVIAECLDVECESLPVLMRLAEAKLAAAGYRPAEPGN
jgi:DNA-directed RNA polymerase specialized sigma24 family protein